MYLVLFPSFVSFGVLYLFLPIACVGDLRVLIFFSISNSIQVTGMDLNSKCVMFMLITFLYVVNGSEVIKFGTFAPKASPWGDVLDVWQKSVNLRSGGKLEIQYVYNGQQGDETVMVAKMKSGQLDGALMTAVGLSRIYTPILALQMPRLFRNWSKLDTARQAMNPDFVTD